MASEVGMVMSAVGCVKVIDRNLIPHGDELLIHDFGAYSEGEFGQVDRSRLIDVHTAADLIVAATADRASVS